MSDRELLVQACYAHAKQLRLNAGGRNWSGPALAESRARLRGQAAELERLAAELRAGTVTVSAGQEHGSVTVRSASLHAARTA
jgi:hypothetical protein